MVYMSHHRHNRRTRDQIVLVILLFRDGVLYLSRDILCGETEFIGYDVDGLRIQTLVDRNHNTDAHTSTDNLVYTHIHHGSKL